MLPNVIGKPGEKAELAKIVNAIRRTLLKVHRKLVKASRRARTRLVEANWRTCRNSSRRKAST
jgi:hypothetical protein